jgi:TIGR03009 family protein
MRRIVGMTWAWVVGIGLASPVLGQQAPATRKDVAPAAPAGAPAAGPPKPAPDPAAQKKMDQLLALWEKQSAKVKTLDATFDRVDESKVWDDVTHYKGRALLKSPNLACLNLERVDADAKKTTFQERVICTGKDVWQYDGASRQITVYHLDPNQQQGALQQGPLPFLFDMRVAEVKAQFDLVLAAENDQTYRIQIWPKQPADRGQFSVAVVDLNKQKFLPDALHLLSPNGKDMQRYYFTTGKITVGKIAIDAAGKIVPNAPINEVNFEGKPWPNWKVVVNPQNQAQPPAGAPGPRVAQPAMRPAGPAGRR